MSLTVKAYFKDEIRRIAVDATSASSFEYLEGKIRSSFPNLPQRGNLIFRWKDVEGELITFSTDDELLEALSSADSGVFKIYLDKKKGGQSNHGEADWSKFCNDMMSKLGEHMPNLNQEVVHTGVECDGCAMKPIQGIRYKCLQCPDFDLCEPCKNAGKHSEHNMEKICLPKTFFMGPNMFPGIFPGGHMFHGRPGGPWRRRGPGGKPTDPQGSSGDEKRCGGAGLMTREDKEKMQEVVQIVKEAAKTSAFEIGGAAAGDCAGATVEVAVRSSIRRALVVRKNTGFSGMKTKKHAKHEFVVTEERKASSSSSEDEGGSSEFEDWTDLDEPTGGRKQMKKVKAAARHVAKIAKKEVNSRFGKLAARWAATTVKQSMVTSIKQSLKAQAKQQKQQPSTSQVPHPAAPVPEVPMEPVYPVLCPEPMEEQPAVSTEEELAINNAIQVFQNMGYKPEDWLLQMIRDCKGSIPMVFDNLRPEAGQ